MMKILHFTYTIHGGAGKVAHKFQQLLQRNGFESAIVNVQVDNPAEQVYLVKALNNPLRKVLNNARYWAFRLYVRSRYKKSKLHNFTYNFNYRNLQLKEIKDSVPFRPDIIFLHWISDFLSPELILQIQQEYKCPVIWRYNDLAPVTGGCHYLAGCDHYKTGCGNCPALGSDRKNDWSHQYWKKKKEVFPNINMSVINSTHHTEVVFKESPLFENKLQFFIRNSLSQELYTYTNDKMDYRQSLQLDPDKKVIFWGATHITEPRKGFNFLLEALRQLSDAERKNILLIIAGNKPADFNPDIPVEHRYVGLLQEKQLISFYKASDLSVCTSLEDGGPMMIVESLLCGTPLVSFATGLALELVISGETGYRAEKSDSKDLAKGIGYVLNLPAAEYRALQAKCHEKALSLYGEAQEIDAYKKLFAELHK